MPMPIDRPINLSSKGTKLTRSITTTFKLKKIKLFFFILY